jgi:hypothetical protein
MRLMKNVYFNQPPRTIEEIVSLMLRPRKTTHTEKSTPLNTPGLEITKHAPHMLGFRTFTADVVDLEESGYGIRVFYGLVKADVLPTGERPSSTYLDENAHLLSSPPLMATDLPDSFFTRRKNEVVMLPLRSSGMVCYLAARYELEKGRNPGPYGPIIHAFVS